MCAIHLESSALTQTPRALDDRRFLIVVLGGHTQTRKTAAADVEGMYHVRVISPENGVAIGVSAAADVEGTCEF